MCGNSSMHWETATAVVYFAYTHMSVHIYVHIYLCMYICKYTCMYYMDRQRESCKCIDALMCTSSTTLWVTTTAAVCFIYTHMSVYIICTYTYVYVYMKYTRMYCVYRERRGFNAMMIWCVPILLCTGRLLLRWCRYLYMYTYICTPQAYTRATYIDIYIHRCICTYNVYSHMCIYKTDGMLEVDRCMCTCINIDDICIYDA